VALVGGSNYEAGLPLVKRAIAADAVYAELLERLVYPPGLISKPDAERLLKDAR
jgi:hypothetical protein